MDKKSTSTTVPKISMTSRFSHMKLVDMRNLFDGIQAAHHILLTNEQVCAGTLLEFSHVWFQSEATRLNDILQEIADAALACQPEDEDDEYEREQILVRAKPTRDRHRTYRTHTTVEVL